MLTKYSETGLAKPRLGRLLHAPLYEVRLKRFPTRHFLAWFQILYMVEVLSKLIIQTKKRSWVQSGEQKPSRLRVLQAAWLFRCNSNLRSHPWNLPFLHPIKVFRGVVYARPNQYVHTYPRPSTQPKAQKSMIQRFGAPFRVSDAITAQRERKDSKHQMAGHFLMPPYP